MKLDRQPASLRYQVQDLLRAEIVSGRLKPKQRIVEKQLCSEMGISRTLLREALRQLEAEGLVDLVPYRGTQAASVTLEDAWQIYDARRILEVQAVEHFTDNADENQVNDLHSLALELEELELEALSVNETLDIKKRFYDIILQDDTNAVLRGVLGILNNRISLLRAISLERPGRVAETIGELKAIIVAVTRRDTSNACEVTEHHINNAADNLLSILRDRNE